MGAGTGGKDEGTSTAQHGLVQGHAYSILDVREVSNTGGLFGGSRGEKFRLIQLRNPWGSFEWTGAWSDGSAEWNNYRKVAKKLKHADADDGIFWMPYDEFWASFKQIDICDRSTGFRDLALYIDERGGFLGPAKGCMWGCFKFWCMCKGCRASTFGHEGAAPEMNHYLAKETVV